MKILTKYVLRHIAWPAALAISAIVFVSVATEIQERLKELPTDQLKVSDITRLAFFIMPSLISYIVPMTYMAGIMLAFGKLAQHGELTAMKAAGMPLKRVVLPVVMVGVFLSLFCFWVQDQVQPWAIKRIYAMVYSEIPLRASLNTIPTGVMQEFRDWRVYIGSRDGREGVLKDIIILKPEGKDGPAMVYYAKTARLVSQDGQTMVEMRDGHLIPAEKEGQVSRVVFDATLVAIPKMEPKKPRGERRALTVQQLLAKEKSVQEKFEATKSEPVMADLYKDREEIGQRLSLPFACLAVAFAAAPLGARTRRAGRSFLFLAGGLVVGGYYLLQMLLTPRALLPLPEVVLIAWVPNLVLCALGMLLTWRVDRV